MGKKDKKIDAYIAKSAPFAKPILKHLRVLVHKSCASVEETWKWSFPNFMYNENILCSMAAFKKHCSFGFWLGALMKDPNGMLLTGHNKTAMGNLGAITSVKDLPSDKILSKYIKEAMSLIDAGAKLPKKENSGVKTLKIPTYLLTELQKNKDAHTTFHDFSYTNKKEYVEWITEAKTEETRNKRLETAIEWMAEGIIRNWQYLKC